jgi:pimeloyl-ACP methyl ester carboxylesterase
MPDGLGMSGEEENMSRRHRALVLVLLLSLVAAGCGSAEPTAATVPAPATRIALDPTHTLRPPTATPALPRATTMPPAATQTRIAPTATVMPTEPAPSTAPIVVEEIRFQSGRFRLVGDLQIPTAEGDYPVIVMVHGDGGIDRTCFGIYQPIVERFLRAGYAVFSWDKPGTGESTGSLAQDSEVLSQRASILVRAIELLKEHPALDPERIGVWGISQAGYVVPLAMTMNADIAFLIVTSGPAMDSYEQGAYLTGQLAFCAGASEEEGRLIEQQMAKADRAMTYEEYRENIVALHEHPVLIEQGIRPTIAPEDEWSPEDRSRLSFFNPIEVIEETTIPVLAIFGERDRQVDPFQGSQAYERALQKAGNQHYLVEVVPETDHNIVLSETGCIAERDRRSMADWLNYAPEYLDLMEEWLVQLSTSASTPRSTRAGGDASREVEGRVDVGGHQLFIHCIGVGAPVVVMEAGWGDTGDTWSLVQPEVAEHTRTCAYDRAGLGHSEAGPEPRTIARVVDELHTLLESANIQGPYIVVGQSWGGLSMRLFADRYPEEVVGLILVDSPHPDVFRRSAAVLPQESPDDSESVRFYRDWLTGATDDPTMEIAPELFEAGSMGDLPVVVLTAMNKQRADDFPADLNDQLNQIWLELQEALARLSSNSTHIVSQESAHMIQQEQPDLVIDAILQVLEAARAE